MSDESRSDDATVELAADDIEPFEAADTVERKMPASELAPTQVYKNEAATSGTPRQSQGATEEVETSFEASDERLDEEGGDDQTIQMQAIGTRPMPGLAPRAQTVERSLGALGVLGEEDGCVVFLARADGEGRIELPDELAEDGAVYLIKARPVRDGE